MRTLLLLLLSASAFGDIYHYGGGVDCSAGTNGQVYRTNGSSCSFADPTLPSFVDSINGFLEAPTDKIFTLDEKAVFAYTINSITTKLVSGTVTVAVKINGTNVTGLSAISATSVQATTTASAANSVVAGDRVTLVTSSGSSPVDLAFTLKYTR